MKRVVEQAKHIIGYRLLRKQLLYTIFIVFVIIVGWYQLVYQPFSLAIAQLEQQQLQAHAERQRLEQLVQQATLYEMKNQLQRQAFETQLHHTYSSLNEQLSSMLSCLIADERTAISCKPQAATTKQWYNKQAVELTLKGSYNMIEHFLNELEKRHIFFDFKKVEIKSVDDSVSFAITIALYSIRQDT